MAFLYVLAALWLGFCSAVREGARGTEAGPWSMQGLMPNNLVDIP